MRVTLFMRETSVAQFTFLMKRHHYAAAAADAIKDDTKVAQMHKSGCGRCHKVNRQSFKCAIFNAGFCCCLFFFAVATPYGRARFLI